MMRVSTAWIVGLRDDAVQEIEADDCTDPVELHLSRSSGMCAKPINFEA